MAGNTNGAKRSGRRPKAGRPSMFTAKVRNDILRAIERGVPKTTAARAAGISITTFYRWMEDAELETEGGPKRQFRDELDTALARGEQHLVDIVAKAAEKDHRAAQWLLERRFNERFAQRSEAKVEHGGRVEQDVVVSSGTAASAIGVAPSQLPPKLQEQIADHFQKLRDEAKAAEEAADAAAKN